MFILRWPAQRSAAGTRAHAPKQGKRGDGRSDWCAMINVPNTERESDVENIRSV
jgi:hypothetical protein